MDNFYEKINLPKNCLVNREINKSKFINSEKIDGDYSYIFNSYVKKITLKYSLKSDILNVEKIKDNYQEYSEIEILEVNLNNHLAVYDVAMVIGRNIPYPLIIIFINGDKYKLASYRVRENKNSYYKNVVEDIVVSGWFKIDDYYGRINEIIEKINFNKLDFSNMFTVFNTYYKIIEEYKAKYIDISNVLDAFSIVKGITHNKEKLMRKCKWTTVDETIKTKIDVYKTDKMNKYNNLVSNAKILLCEDDLFQYIKDNSHIKFKSFKIFEDTIIQLKRKKDIEDLMKRKHNKWDCCYYDGKICINSYSGYYGKSCTRAFECELFRKELIKNKSQQINIENSLYGISNVLKKENFNNTNINVVEYGDMVEVLDINNNKIKKFMIINISGKLPTIPEKCLNKSKNQTFEVNNTIFKIENIIKNVSEENKKITEIAEESNLSKDVVEYGDVVEALNLRNNQKEYFEIRKVDNYTPIINILCLGKSIDYRFKNGGKSYKIIGIKKGVIYDKFA